MNGQQQQALPPEMVWPTWNPNPTSRRRIARVLSPEPDYTPEELRYMFGSNRMEKDGVPCEPIPRPPPRMPAKKKSVSPVRPPRDPPAGPDSEFARNKAYFFASVFRPFDVNVDNKPNTDAEDDYKLICRLYSHKPILHVFFVQLHRLLPKLPRCGVLKGRPRAYWLSQRELATKLAQSLIQILHDRGITTTNEQAKIGGRYAHRLNEYLESLDLALNPPTYDVDMAKAAKVWHPTEVHLKPYNGNILNWKPFWATFNELVVENAYFTDWHKFAILESCLDEETLIIMAPFSYWRPQMVCVRMALEEYFADQLTLLCHLTPALMEFPLMKNHYDINHWEILLEGAKKARPLLDDLPRPRTVEWIDFEKDMVITLLRKVPPGQSDDYPPGEWSFVLLIAFFERKIATLKAMVADGVNLSELAADLTDKLCPICEKDYHAPERCPLPPRMRLGVLMFIRKDRMYCLYCLEPMKWTHDCGEPKCTTCGGEHHAAVCCPDVSIFENMTYPFEYPKRHRDDPKEPEKEKSPKTKQPDEPQVAPYQHSLSPMPQSEFQFRAADWPSGDDRPFTVC